MQDSPLRSPLRFAASALCAVAAASHIPVIDDHLTEAPYIGVLFIALTAACLVEAVLLLWGDRRWVWLLASATCASAVGAYVWSRSIGLPLIQDDVGNWTEPLGLVALTSESLVVVLSIAALVGNVRHWAPRPMASRAPVIAGVVVMLLGLGWTGVAAASTDETSSMAMPDATSSMAMAGTQDANYWDAVGGAPFHSDGVTRVYYISADLVTWDYAPTGKNQITGKPFDEVADTYVKTGPGRIGSRYLKCLYRQYTNGTFAQVKQRPADEQYLGLLGPVIRAAVGDTIRVVYRNTCPFPTSMHPHGVFYTKSSEGAPYNDGTTGADKADDDVPTGGKHTFVWQVPERAGPGPGDGSSVMWMYHSHSDEITDTYAGLMGPMVVTRQSMARTGRHSEGRRRRAFRDVHRHEREQESVPRGERAPFRNPVSEAGTRRRGL